LITGALSHQQSDTSFVTAPTSSFSGLIAPVVGSRMQVPTHSSTALRSRAMHPPPPSQGPPSEGRDWRGQAMEETMPHWTITELMYLTRDELCDLAAWIMHNLPELDAGTVARFNALASLDNIRRVMVLRDLHP
jgi:hypothetical protein